MHLTAVIFDWAGTVVDHGSRAPVATLLEVFQGAGVAITVEEARLSMGIAKRAHIASILALPRVASDWQRQHGAMPADVDVDRLYAAFVPKQLACLERYSDVITGVPAVVEQLRARGLKIGTTTGYTRPMLDFLLAEGRNAGMWTIGITRTGNEVGILLRSGRLRQRHGNQMRWRRPPFVCGRLALITWWKASPSVSALSIRSTRALLPGNGRDCFGIHQTDARTEARVVRPLAGMHRSVDGRRLRGLLPMPLRPVGRHAVVADSRDGKPRRMGWAGMVKITSRWSSYSAYGTAMGIISLSYLFGDAAAREFMARLIDAGAGWRGVFLAAAGTLALLLLLKLLTTGALMVLAVAISAGRAWLQSFWLR